MNRNKKENDSYFWDKKSEIYPRYNPKNETFQSKILQILKDNRVINKESLVLDIGCGSGVYTIPFAKDVKKITAFDLSKKMLEVLKEDANFNGVNNIKTFNSNFDDFNIKEKFDLVFASKTPAIREEKDYLKMEHFSKKSVAYLGFAGLKSSNIQKELEKRYNFKFRVFDETTSLKKWLITNNKKFTSNIFEETLSRQISQEEATSHIKEYSNKVDVKLSEEEIADILLAIEKDGKLSYDLEVRLELLLWEK